MRYGLPYMGSKNKIAELIVNKLPRADNLYDLFCGGCAITHCALLQNKYNNYYINDIQQGQAQFFLDCINGKYKDETRWISREEFKEKHRVDPYIACVWSFGNKGYTYLYGEDIEESKRLMWNAIMLDDFEPLEKYIGFTIKDSVKQIKDKHKRRIAIKKDIKKIAELHPELTKLEPLDRLPSLERLQSMQSLERLTQKKIIASCKSYDEVEIKPNSVIYCDIPYQDTQMYLTNGGGNSKRECNTFDYEKFYEWCSKQTELVVISSYEIKDSRLIEVWNIEKTCSLSATNNAKKSIERLYVPVHQLELWKKYNEKYTQTTIFDI